MIPNVPMMTGQDAVGKTMKDAVSDPNWSFALQPVQVDVRYALARITTGMEDTGYSL